METIVSGVRGENVIGAYTYVEKDEEKLVTNSSCLYGVHTRWLEDSIRRLNIEASNFWTLCC